MEFRRSAYDGGEGRGGWELGGRKGGRTTGVSARIGSRETSQLVTGCVRLVRRSEQFRSSSPPPLCSKMSWQDYVDKQLLASRCVTKAAIAGHDGNVWAKSDGFEVSSTLKENTEKRERDREHGRENERERERE